MRNNMNLAAGFEIQNNFNQFRSEVFLPAFRSLRIDF